MSTTNLERTRRPGRRALLPLGLALAGLWLASAGAQEEQAEQLSARQTVERALGKVTEILLSDTLSKKDKRSQVQDLIEAEVDFETVSRLALARNWRKLSEPQQKEFVDLFQRHLLLTYWKNADYSNFKGIEVKGDRKEPRRDWTVLSVVKSSNSDDILIDYRLRQEGEEGDEGGRWRIIDILVEGVSLVSNFRSQFQSMISNGGPEKLIADLRTKVTEGEAAEAQKDSE